VPVLRSLGGVHLAIVGDGPTRPELEQAFGRLPVTFTGYLHGGDLAQAYASADLFVFPSDSEAFGNVVLEAMASGLPVVAAAAGGVADLVEHDTTGLMFEPAAPDDLGRCVRAYLADAALRERHGQAARAAAESRTWSRQQRLLLAHYAAVLHGARAGDR
jgi:phosphatidylinositol alpha 1,6-mannosyltransferase